MYGISSNEGLTHPYPPSEQGKLPAAQPPAQRAVLMGVGEGHMIQGEVQIAKQGMRGGLGCGGGAM